MPLDAAIIKEIERREEEKRRQEENRPRVELPVPPLKEEFEKKEEADKDEGCGVTVIDLNQSTAGSTVFILDISGP